MKNRSERIKLLGQKYFGFKFSSSSQLVKIENKKRESTNNFEQRKRLILEENILNQDQLKNFKIDQSTRHKSSLQFQLYLNKGVNLNIENYKDQEAQTEISGLKFNDSSNASSLQSIIMSNSENMNKTIEKLSISLENIHKKLNFNEISSTISSLNIKLSTVDEAIDDMSEDDDDDQKPKGSDSLSKNIIEGRNLAEKLSQNYMNLTQELKKIIDECDLMIKENDNLKESVAQIKERQEYMVESYNEIFNNVNKGIIETNKKIDKFLFEKKPVLTPETVSFFKEIQETYQEIIGEGKIKNLLFR